FDEFGIRHRLTGGAARSATDDLGEQNQRENDADPDQQALGPRIAGLLFLVVHLSSFRRRTSVTPKIGACALITMRALECGERLSRWRTGLAGGYSAHSKAERSSSSRRRSRKMPASCMRRSRAAWVTARLAATISSLARRR